MLHAIDGFHLDWIAKWVGTISVFATIAAMMTGLWNVHVWCEFHSFGWYGFQWHRLTRSIAAHGFYIIIIALKEGRELLNFILKIQRMWAEIFFMHSKRN